ncbi:MAG: hypothetical protein QFB87_00250 [Patescibacteria group bacterium]|nr:hypothetical protein [Patescibacteria group bacterium]
MKQKDIAMIVAVAGISTIIAFVLASLVIGGPKKRQAQVPVLDSISSNFTQPDKRYFNDQSIDSTQTVTIGSNSNSQPFKQ